MVGCHSSIGCVSFCRKSCRVVWLRSSEVVRSSPSYGQTKSCVPFWGLGEDEVEVADGCGGPVFEDEGDLVNAVAYEVSWALETGVVGRIAHA